MRAWVRRLQAVAEEADAGLDLWGYAAAWLRARCLHAVSLLPADEARPLIREGERSVALWAGHEDWHQLVASLVWVHLNIPEPSLARAERHLDILMRSPATSDPSTPISQASAMVEWAFARGDGAEAQLWAERYLATAQAIRHQVCVEVALGMLEACERLQHAQRHRHAKPLKRAERAAK